MRTEERRGRIITLLFENRMMKVADLIDQVGDSPSSIRRDLTFLEKNGTIERSFGYAKYAKYVPNAGIGPAASPEAWVMANTAWIYLIKLLVHLIPLRKRLKNIKECGLVVRQVEQLKC